MHDIAHSKGLFIESLSRQLLSLDIAMIIRHICAF
jgi:hypothetical protein